MKLTRRSIFGVLGGAAVAGPKLAAEIASNAASMAAPAMSGAMGYATAAGDNGAWKLERIAHLKSILSGKDPHAKRAKTMQRLYMAETIERHRLDSLRSIAPHHKIAMLIEGEPERQERARLADAGFELASLLEMKLPV